MDEYILVLTWLDKKSKTVVTTSKISFAKEADANRAYRANSEQSASLPYEIVAHKLY